MESSEVDSLIHLGNGGTAAVLPRGVWDGYTPWEVSMCFFLVVLSHDFCETSIYTHESWQCKYRRSTYCHATWVCNINVEMCTCSMRITRVGGCYRSRERSMVVQGDGGAEIEPTGKSSLDMTACHPCMCVLLDMTHSVQPRTMTDANRRACKLVPHV